MEYDLNNRADNQEVIDYIFDKGFLKGIDKGQLLKDMGFYEFTLEELGFPSHEQILKSTEELLSLVPSRRWASKNTTHRDYHGISLTFNPYFAGSQCSVFHQTLGDEKLSQSFGREKGIISGNTKNTYYDGLAFTHIHPLVNEHFHNIFNVTDCALSRSRIGIFESKYYEENEETGTNWHKDDPPYQLFRVNIPVITSPGHILKIKGQDEFGNTLELEKHLEVGKAYIWNTRIPHTVYAPPNEQCQRRVHIVLGFLPYLKYNSQHTSLITNDLYGKPMDEIIAKKMWCKNVI